MLHSKFESRIPARIPSQEKEFQGICVHAIVKGGSMDPLQKTSTLVDPRNPKAELPENKEVEVIIRSRFYSRVTGYQFRRTGLREIVLNFRTGEFFSGTYCTFYDF